MRFAVSVFEWEDKFPRNIADGTEEAFFFELMNRQKELGLLFSPFSTLAIY